MPLRSDPTAWWNLGGIVAAYQPVRAPGPLLARYNMRAGGTNAYQAVPGTAPTWAAATGWSFNGTTTYLDTTIIPSATSSMLIRFSGVSAQMNICGVVESIPTNAFFALDPWRTVGNHRFSYGATNTVAGTAQASGVMAITNRTGYMNGVSEAALAEWVNITHSVFIGCRRLNANADLPSGASNVQAFAIYSRNLSAAEVWSISQQMAYCDVNPDWNVWAPKRRWYFPPTTTSVSGWPVIGPTFIVGRVQ